MKYVYLIFLIICLFAHFCTAQSITDEGNQWNIRQISMSGPGTSTHILRIEGDTSFSEIVYKKVWMKTDTLSDNWFLSNYYIRKDSQKVYVKEAFGWGAEYPLYDFSLEVGDTFVVDSGYCSALVINVDSVELNNGEKRKRLYLQGTSIAFKQVEWIEGIGTARGGLTTGNWEFCSTDYLEQLLCFYIDGVLQYPVNPWACFLAPVQEIGLESSLKVFPNPASDRLFIESEGVEIAHLRLYHADGKLAKQQKIGHSQTELLTNHLPEGVYFLLLNMETGAVFSQKVVIRH